MMPKLSEIHRVFFRNVIKDIPFKRVIIIHLLPSSTSIQYFEYGKNFSQFQYMFLYFSVDQKTDSSLLGKDRDTGVKLVNCITMQKQEICRISYFSKSIFFEIMFY